jgi:hypothetical protein
MAAVGAITTMGVATFATVSPAGATVMGPVSCTGASKGKVSYKPAWTDNGSGTVTGTFSLKVTGCTGGIPTPSAVKIKGTFTFPNGGGGCSDGVNATSTLNVKWKASPKVPPSQVTSNWEIDNTIIDSGPTVTVTGSYPTTGGFLSTGGGRIGDCLSGVKGTKFSSTTVSGF